jgi:hypothetical protein
MGVTFQRCAAGTGSGPVAVRRAARAPAGNWSAVFYLSCRLSRTPPSSGGSCRQGRFAEHPVEPGADVALGGA